MKKTFYISILVLFAIFVLNNCTKDFKEFTPKDITPFLIHKGSLIGEQTHNIPQQNLVITNQTDWNTLILAMHKPDKLITSNIDFKYSQIIAVFSEVKPHNGHAIEIVEITEYKKDLSVKVHNINSGSISPIMNQAFHIVKIPKTYKEIRFISINIESLVRQSQNI